MIDLRCAEGHRLEIAQTFIAVDPVEDELAIRVYMRAKPCRLCPVTMTITFAKT